MSKRKDIKRTRYNRHNFYRMMKKLYKNYNDIDFLHYSEEDSDRYELTVKDICMLTSDTTYEPYYDGEWIVDEEGNEYYYFDKLRAWESSLGHRIQSYYEKIVGRAI